MVSHLVIPSLVVLTLGNLTSKVLYENMGPISGIPMVMEQTKTLYATVDSR